MGAKNKIFRENERGRRNYERKYDLREKIQIERKKTVKINKIYDETTTKHILNSKTDSR